MRQWELDAGCAFSLVGSSIDEHRTRRITLQFLLVNDCSMVKTPVDCI